MTTALKTLMVIAGILGAGVTVSRADDSTSFLGRWELVFEFLRDTANPNQPVRPWLTFDADFRQEGTQVIGTIKARGRNTAGTITGGMTADGLVGTMRFSWDDHDWQLFTLRLIDGTDSGEGIAVFAPGPPPEKARHVYTIRCQRVKEPSAATAN